LAGGLISARFFSSFNLNEGSNQGRLAIWQESFNVFLENPILGVGLGNYPLTTNPYLDYRTSVTSHNLYLDILAETGIFGLLAWLWFIVAAAKAAWRKIKSVQKEDWIVGLGTLGALVYFSVHSFFETAIFNPTILAFLMIVCGLAAANIRSIPARR
jgi:O-antigen ligase